MGRLLTWLRKKRSSTGAGQRSRWTTSKSPPAECSALFPDGVKVLHDCPDAAIDICFIHGLTGDRDSTWTVPGQEYPWPKTLLPPKLQNARILTYGYDAYVMRKRGVTGTNGLIDHASNFLHDLTADRTTCNASSRPLILVAHSLGGLVCKEAVLRSRNNPELHLRGIFESLKGIAFMGTPHRGSWMADWARIPASALGFVGANTSLLASLKTDSQLLESVHAQFWQMVRELRENGRLLEVTCFFEELPLPVAGIVVPKESATLEGYNSITVHADHKNLVRFASVEDNGFKRLLGELVRWESQVRNGQTGALSRVSPSCGPNTQIINGITTGSAPAYIAQNQIINQTIVQNAPIAMPGPAQRCLRSLAFPKMQDRSLEIDRAVSGTCDWLLQHETYRAWSAHDRGFLWIKGKPGSGKSTLLKYALDNHEVGAGDLVLSFFFHGRGDELQRSPLGFLRSLLHQILGKAPDSLAGLVDTFEERYNEMGNPGDEWNWKQKELQHFVESSLQKVLEVRSAWLFVDALDECGKDNAVFLFRWLKSLLSTLQPTSSQSRIQVCISCRHYPVLGRDCEFVICPEDQNMQDISTYVRAQLSESPELAASCIPGLITDYSYGVFMWARLVVEQVLDLDREGAPLGIIAEGMVSIPPDLDQLYEDLARDMEPASSKLIQWICFANRPLSLDELRWAMVIDVDSPYRSLEECRNSRDYIPDNDRMRKRLHTLSRGLVEVTESSTVQLIHQSVEDFFTNQKGLSLLMNNLPSPVTDKDLLADDLTPDIAVGMAHFRIARICLRYLAMEEISQSTDTTSYEHDDFPFLRYATSLWIRHAQNCYAARDDLLGTFSWLPDDLLNIWVRVWDTLEYTYTSGFPPKGTNIFHIVSRYGFSRSLEAIIQGGDLAARGIDSGDRHAQTPLYWAARRGREECVELLLATGEVNVNSTDVHGQTPLSVAAENGHDAIVRLLMHKSKAEVDSMTSGGHTPLLRAAENGHEVVVRTLLATGAVDVNTKAGNDWTPLLTAIRNGHENIARLLIATPKVDINAMDTLFNRTPLSWAARDKHQALVELLLATPGIEVDLGRDQTPLSYAAAAGDVNIVNILLATGKVDLNSKDEECGRTPLSFAAGNGHEQVVKILLATGEVDVDSKCTQRGRTPLSYAAQEGHAAVVSLLLATGKVDVESKDGFFSRTPLEWAIVYDRKAVVEILSREDKALGRGDDGNVTSTEHYHTASDIPVGRNGNEGIRGIIKVINVKSSVEDALQDYDGVKHGD